MMLVPRDGREMRMPITSTATGLKKPKRRQMIGLNGKEE
jgi:hypothetical protein